MSLKKRLRKIAVVAAVAVASYYTGGAAAAAYAKYRAAKKAAAAPTGPQFIGVPPDYSAPYNPGYSYTGSPDQFTGAATQTFGGYGGAAVPIEKAPPELARSGFNVTPIMALGALGLLGIGFVLLRR